MNNKDTDVQKKQKEPHYILMDEKSGRFYLDRDAYFASIGKSDPHKTNSFWQKKK